MPDININVSTNSEGDTVGGDKVGQDKITTGNVSGSGIGIGRESSTSVTGIDMEAYAQILSQVMELKSKVFILEERYNGMETRVKRIEQFADDYGHIIGELKSSDANENFSRGVLVFIAIIVTMVMVSTVLYASMSGVW